MNLIALVRQIFFPRILFLILLSISAVVLLFSTNALAQDYQKVDLSLSPQTQTVSANQSFSLDVEIDGKANKVSAASFEINFDPEFLEVKSINPRNYLPTILVPTHTDNINGKITATLGATVNNPPSGVGQLMTIEFKSLKNTSQPTKIIINPNSAVAVIEESANMIGQITNSSITIGGGTSSVIKTASFELTGPETSPKVNQEFPIVLRTTSSVDEANLFSAQINFDKEYLEVSRIETGNSFVTQWVSKDFDNNSGLLKIVGGVPNPGFKTPELGSDLATIIFKPKKSGSSLLTFSDASAIYRNSDNADILSLKTPLLLEVSPSATPTPSPTPTATPVTTPTPTPTPTATPTPTPSPCTINGATWATSGPVTEGKIVSLTINGSGDCHGKQINITVKEDDGVLGSQNVKANPVSATFSGTSAQTSWVSEYQPDGVFGVWDPAEYFFNAQIAGSNTIFKSTNRLTVTKLLAGQNPKGDGDNDGVVNLKDLSILFTNWNNQNFPLNLDINDDGKLNSFDFSGLLQLLKTSGAI